MFKRWSGAGLGAIVIAISAMASAAHAQGARPSGVEAYIPEPVPSFVRVVQTELDGPLFADGAGHVFYVWKADNLRLGRVGDEAGKPPSCENTHLRVTIGSLPPYPAGLELPDVEQRPTCTELWPPVYAADNAAPIGAWTIIERKDGRKQWAYEDFPVYTSALDEANAPVGSGVTIRAKGETGILRQRIGPKSDVPSQFIVVSTKTGRLLTLLEGPSVYTRDLDRPNTSTCDGACLTNWRPVLAPAMTPTSRGEWGVIERAPGVKQWTFRKKPLYTRPADTRPHSFDGGDVPGWHNVYVYNGPSIPADFTVQDTTRGQVVADARGRTIYSYSCVDDAADQLACDHPSLTQAYRYAVCGGGDPERCRATFPYVIADKDAKSSNKTWSVISIDPVSGKYAARGQADALRVWAYRGRPVYTFVRDQARGDIEADAWGEFSGFRNGFHAIWMRDQFNNYNE